MTTLKLTTFICSIMLIIITMDDTMNHLHKSSVTIPAECTHDHAGTLCMTRTDSEYKLEPIGDVTITRISSIDDVVDKNTISLNHGLHVSRCCSVCSWPRKKFHHIVNNMRCDEHCINPFNLWVFRALKRKQYSNGGCFSQGYGQFMNTTLDTGNFQLPTDVYTKFIIPYTNQNTTTHKVSLANGVINLWSSML